MKNGLVAPGSANDLHLFQRLLTANEEFYFILLIAHEQDIPRGPAAAGTLAEGPDREKWRFFPVFFSRPVKSQQPFPRRYNRDVPIVVREGFFLAAGEDHPVPD